MLSTQIMYFLSNISFL